MNVKVLPLAFYKFYKGERLNNFQAQMNERYKHELECYYEEIPPEYNRDGWYLLGDKCWFETNGKAYLYNKKQFDFEMNLKWAGEFDIATVGAIRNLEKVCESVLSKEQKKLLQFYNYVEIFKKDKRESLLRIRRIRERAEAYKKANKK